MDNTRHILGISGGKDSAALAIYMRDKIPDMEYVFADTGKELKETYTFIKKLEGFLNKEVIKLPYALENISDNYDFDTVLALYNGFLPSAQARWCTKKLKLDPFEKFIGDNNVINYVGIRYDELREGYITSKPNVKTVFPFVEDKIDLRGVNQILERSGVGIPDYYKWRSRSGCYFCFYQTKKEWLGLKKRHPDLFKDAKNYEDVKGGYTWREDISLSDLEKIGEQLQESSSKKNKFKTNRLIHLLDEDFDKESIEKPCLICHL